MKRLIKFRAVGVCLCYLVCRVARVMLDQSSEREIRLGPATERVVHDRESGVASVLRRLLPHSDKRCAQLALGQKYLPEVEVSFGVRRREVQRLTHFRLCLTQPPCAVTHLGQQLMPRGIQWIERYGLAHEAGAFLRWSECRSRKPHIADNKCIARIESERLLALALGCGPIPVVNGVGGC